VPVYRLSLSRCYDRLAGTQATAAEALLERKKLWPGHASRLTDVSRDLRALAQAAGKDKGKLSPRRRPSGGATWPKASGRDGQPMRCGTRLAGGRTEGSRVAHLGNVLHSRSVVAIPDVSGENFEGDPLFQNRIWSVRLPFTSVSRRYW
jgi:hypothetical protein